MTDLHIGERNGDAKIGEPVEFIINHLFGQEQTFVRGIVTGYDGFAATFKIIQTIPISPQQTELIQ